MVSTQQRAVPSTSLTAPPAVRTDAATQPELGREHVVAEVPGCRVCPSFCSVSDGSSDFTCGRWAQVKELLSLVAELQEALSRLKGVRERD